MDTQPQSIKTNQKQPLSWKKVALVVVTLIFAFLFPFMLHRVIVNTANSLNKGKVGATGKQFEILSEPPESAIVGEEYLYYVRIGQFDSPRVYVTTKVSPEWLEWDEEKMKLSGKPDEKYVGQNHVVITATDTTTTKEQAFSIYVEESTIADVKGAQDTVSRVTDSEVTASASCQRYYNELGPLGVLSEHPECEGIFYQDTKKDKQVLGISDTVRDIFGGASGEGLPTVSASIVDRRIDIFGFKISKNLEIGLIASMAVVVIGLTIVAIWVSISTVRHEDGEEDDNSKKKVRNIGNQKEGRQQSFIKKGDETQVIIWD
jgi:hypothetical protein